ncbi:Polysaccharide lyase [Rhabdaerophilaceae bacterium]
MKKNMFLALLVLASWSAPATFVSAQSWKNSLQDGFESGDFAPSGGLFYKKNKEQEKGSATFQSEIVRNGQRALRLSVEPSCPSSGTECSERAEVWERPDILAPYDQPLWYAFSMRLGEPVPREMHRLVMAQWKREILPGADGDFSPFLALRLSAGRLIATVVSDEASFAPKGVGERVNGCKPGEAPANTPDDHRQVRATIAMDVPLSTAYAEAPGCSPAIRVTPRDADFPKADSGWIDYVFLVNPDPAGKGVIEIAANGRWVATVEGSIGHRGAGLAETQYFKFGPYRAGRPDNWTLYFDDFKRSPRCLDVGPAELCNRISAATGRF